MNITEMQQELERLLRSRASGARRVRFQTHEVEFRSDTELAAAIGDLESRIAAAVKPLRRIIYPRTSKGY